MSAVLDTVNSFVNLKGTVERGSLVNPSRGHEKEWAKSEKRLMVMENVVDDDDNDDDITMAVVVDGIVISLHLGIRSSLSNASV